MLANRLRIKKIIEKKEGETYCHFHVRVEEYRDVTINLHKIWKHLPSTKEKREVVMKLCCVNYQKVFTEFEKNLIEQMETLA